MAIDRLLDLFAHRFLCFSSIYFCFFNVRETKLASSLMVNVWEHGKIAIDSLIDRHFLIVLKMPWNPSLTELIGHACMAHLLCERKPVEVFADCMLLQITSTTLMTCTDRPCAAARLRATVLTSMCRLSTTAVLFCRPKVGDAALWSCVGRLTPACYCRSF